MIKFISQSQKTCSVCGQSKPMAAFILQLSKKISAICNVCRSGQHDKDTSASTGAKIDHKTRLAVEKSKIEKKIAKETLDHDTRTTLNNESVVRDTKQTDERHLRKKHHDHYLAKQTSTPDTQKTASASFFVGGEAFAEKERQIDLTAPVQDTQIAGKIKHNNASFNQFKSWLGNSAPIVKRTEPFAKQLEKEGKSLENLDINEFIKSNLGKKR